MRSNLISISISIHALREEGDPHPIPSSPLSTYFYPRPPRGGRRWSAGRSRHRLWNFYPRPPRGGRPERTAFQILLAGISIHALREEGDQELLVHTAVVFNFYPRPPRGGRLLDRTINGEQHVISIHALREEGDSKNGEKHLRFCFIIKRSAQIWKSLSKNIRKNSCDLHRTA